ncbi:MAG: MBL fold metallo-hydrolase [Synergistetes bacterium]|nr:MBL fold metallo-hydrolase [Synergistota bacterium]
MSTTSITLYEDEEHKFILLGWEEEEEEGIVQTNQYLILDRNEAVLLDPGGAHVFPRVLANVAEHVSLDQIKHIFFSHQDPDVSSGVMLWLSIAERANIYISELWLRFLPHFGIYDQKRVKGIPDRGMKIKFGSGRELECLPAHFLHSLANFSLYDPTSKILFSGDIGAAIFPKGGRYPIVEDFQKHLKLMEGFHRRYMVSGKACKKWVDIVSQRKIDMIAPQHGAVMKGESVKEFLRWFSNLTCGVELIDEIYGR